MYEVIIITVVPAMPEKLAVFGQEGAPAEPGHTVVRRYELENTADARTTLRTLVEVMESSPATVGGGQMKDAR